MDSDPVDAVDAVASVAEKPSHPPKDPGPRHLAREAALQVLFALDVAQRYESDEVEQCLREYWDHLEGPPLGRIYGDEVVRGVAAKITEVDAEIRAANPNWRIERMARVDRNVLRIAAWEVLYSPEGIHPRVAIDEAIELAKRYGAEDAPAFVNGVLDRLSRNHAKL